jgi:hypothetical protein
MVVKKASSSSDVIKFPYLFIDISPYVDISPSW